MIKLLALDLDGTTLNSQGEIDQETRNAIRAAETEGVLVTIATGRRFRDAQPVGAGLRLNAPLITHNGGLLKYADSLETVAYSLLPAYTSQAIIELGRSLGGDALVSADPHGRGTLLYDRVSKENIPLQKYISWSQTLHGDEAGTAVINVKSLLDEVQFHEVVHISFSGNCQAMQHLDDQLRKMLNASVTVLSTVYPRRDLSIVDVLPPHTSKGHGVLKLAEINGFLRDEIMAVGDNFNDLDMLNAAGTAVVMGNADARLRERKEFYTTLSNDEAGVAASIERFILNKENI